MDQGHMREYWNERAREDAYFFVDSRRSYRDPELSDFWEQGEQDLDRLLDSLDLKIEAGDVVLDLGCGVGRLTGAIAARAARAYGLDVSDEMIELARSKHSDLRNVEWLVGDGMSLRPLEDDSIDACLSYAVFRHIPRRSITVGYVREISRVLRSGGWTAFQVSNDPRAHRRPAAVRSGLQRVRAAAGRSPSGQDDPAWIGSAISLDALHVATFDSGLELERVVGEGTEYCLVLARKL